MSEQSKQKYQESKLYKVRHSVAHIMAQAVLERFPDTRIAIGPPIETGFYYDFEFSTPISESDLEPIEARMKEIIREKHEFSCAESSADELRKQFASQPYKIELIDDILSKGTDEYGKPLQEGQTPILTVYQHSNFYDLCRGPHVSSTTEINPDAVKLLRIAGAYWRGDENRTMLTRIYGTAWETKEELDEYLESLEEAKRRDHRVIGKNLELYSQSDEVGPGLVLWHPKGALIRYLAERFSQDAHVLNGYEWVYTPHIGRACLWETSGHLDFFKDAMYNPISIDNEQYYLKPMNCPFHIQIYKKRLRAYRELPKRYAEFGQVYRYERSGVLHGLTRVRGFCQDDAHTFCTPDQIGAEIHFALRFCLYILRSFGLTKFKAYISTKPEGKAIGDDKDWQNAIQVLRNAVDAEGLPFEVDEGGGAFYGPKIDLKLTDSLDREWQLSTVQLDFNLPERFELEYIGSDGKAHRPMMVHRALYGSAERFLAMLTEHYAGAFPLWLAPVQVMVVPVSDKNNEYAQAVVSQLKASRIRTSIDERGERMQAKIRDAEMDKIPYILIVGKREAESKLVSVRSRVDGDKGQMTVQSFLDSLQGDLGAGIPAALD
jgi:threonyl-tRNA synthetase